MEEVIYKHETNGEFTGIYAQIEDGKLTITEQDMGEFEKEYSRDGEVESFVFFDVANTNRLMRSLHASDDYSLIESLNPNRSLDRTYFYLFCTFMLSVVFLFSISVFLPTFS